MLDHPETVRGRHVLDLATGSGLVAIAAAKAGAASVTANDIDPFSVEAVALNAALNGVSVAFDRRDLLARETERFDIVLAGDVFYDKAMADAVLPFLDAQAGRGATVLVGDPGRSYLPRSHLTQLAVHEVAVTRALEDGEVKRTVVWQLAKA